MGNAINFSARKSMILLGSLVFFAASPALAQTAGDPIPNSFICVFKPGPITVSFEAQKSVGKAGGQVTRLYHHALHGFAASLPEVAVAKMVQDNPLIDYCEQDRIASIPPGDATPSSVVQGKPGGGGGGGSAQQIPWGIARVHGPSNFTGKTAWVIDSGIDLTHPDLNVDVAQSKSYLLTDRSPTTPMAMARMSQVLSAQRIIRSVSWAWQQTSRLSLVAFWTGGAMALIRA